MAICDARYVFRHIDIGSYGSNNDSGIIRNSKMREQLFENEVQLPEANSLKVRNKAFPLQSWLLRLYPGQGILEEQVIVNYRS